MKSFISFSECAGGGREEIGGEDVVFGKFPLSNGAAAGLGEGTGDIMVAEEECDKQHSRK